MFGFATIKSWYRDRNWNVPVDIKPMFFRESTLENLPRLRIIAFLVSIVASVSITSNLIQLFSGEDKWIQVIIQSVMLLFSVVFSLYVPVLQRKAEIISDGWIRFVQFAFLLLFMFWGNSTCLDPQWQDHQLLTTVGALFTISSLLFLSATEMAAILIYTIGLIMVVPSIFGIHLYLLLVEEFVVGLSLISAFAISRVLYFSRLHAFINWENISKMNSTLKREIHLHLETSKELEGIKNHLDKQVREKTKNLRETNHRLQEEIAEKNYADKVKNVLYRISSMVNRNQDLTSTMRFVHEQLSQVMNVTNFMINLFERNSNEMVPLFQDNQQEQFERYKIDNTLSGLVVKRKESILVNQKQIRQLAKSGEIQMVGIPAHSWLGVPLLSNGKVIGLLMAQSYVSSHEYDTADQKLLEYVGEHLANAIDRVEILTKLMKAKERAEESDRLKSAFLSNLSHEVRTPLNAIVGFTEILADGELTLSERQFYSTQVMENGQRLLSTLTNMVELAKIQSDQLQLSIEPVDVATILDQMGAEAKQLVLSHGKKDIDVRVVVPEDSINCKVAVDLMRFKQLLFCLVENAVKFTYEGHIELGFQIYNTRSVLFYVKDTGIGMNDIELNSIYSSFSKAMNPGEKFYNGPGLGLTIVKSLVENMKGSIWAESEATKGSCFYFTLPVYLPGRTIPLEKDQSSKSTASDQQMTNAV